VTKAKGLVAFHC